MATKYSARPSLAELVAESLELHTAGQAAQDEIRESLECRYPLLRALAKLAAKARPASHIITEAK